MKKEANLKRTNGRPFRRSHNDTHLAAVALVSPSPNSLSLSLSLCSLSIHLSVSFSLSFCLSRPPYMSLSLSVCIFVCLSFSTRLFSIGRCFHYDNMSLDGGLIRSSGLSYLHILYFSLSPLPFSYLFPLIFSSFLIFFFSLSLTSKIFIHISLSPHFRHNPIACIHHSPLLLYLQIYAQPKNRMDRT